VQKKALTIGPEAVKDNKFEVVLDTEPTTIWSGCVGPSGDVPHLTVKTTVGLVGTKGVLGGDNTDMAKGLRINFRPVWDPCPAT